MKIAIYMNITLSQHYRFLSDLSSDDKILADMESVSCPVYVMCNENKLLAATSLLKTELIKKFCDRIKSDLWVIGSSIHEILLIPSELGTYESICEMMAQANEDMDKTEVLATHPYYFQEMKVYPSLNRHFLYLRLLCALI